MIHGRIHGSLITEPGHKEMLGSRFLLAQSAISISLLLCLAIGLASNRRRTKERTREKLGSTTCNCNRERAEQGQQQAFAYRQPGASIMEQLVPEITQHMLSYLDYRSLCNVSMTNSCMRRVANDDSIWKSLFHKDFTSEQSCVILPSGWKAHYAVTKAVLEVNRNFYKSFHAKSIKGMNRLWLHSDYVKCIHPHGECLSGYESIMEHWRTVFGLNQRFDFELQEERARVFGNVAWVTLKECVNSSTDLLTTNVFELHHGHWYMVHHHSSLQLEGGNLDFGPFVN
ncbi:hypothetical protein KP509_36G006000 [Ceratopteris richardii]|uniref:F-box domain-containing protein n=1 Tax=Ceratopteris richardii TaxID=49495 RepID=A0A8T2QAI3_CERRI|nr:hypothetical protein KP509_36G006000 [Ceratopteris richardii]